MEKINWVNFLHIYQPPWQSQGILEQVSSQSYEYLLVLMKRYPKFRCSLNIPGSLLEQLEDWRPDLIKQLAYFFKRGQLELTGTAKYHGLLPLLPEAELIRQIKINQESLGKYFDLKKIKGFYLPEMAFSPNLPRVIKTLGFEWIIVDPIAYAGKVDNQVLYILKSSGLKVIFRDRKISQGYPPEYIFHKLKTIKKPTTIITATDGEMYGHQHNDWQGHIEKILLSPDLVVKTVGEHIKSLSESKTIDLRASSWEASNRELKNRQPFVLWFDHKNKIHQDLWQLFKLASHLVNKYKKDKNYKWARWHLDRGISSCTWWWASAKRPSAFSPLTWNPDMIEAGAKELIQSVRSINLADVSEKIKAENLYLAISKEVWQKHWRKYSIEQQKNK